MSNEKTKNYIVIKRGVCLKGIIEEELNAKVDLTETKAGAMVGKVRLLEDYEADAKPDAELAKTREALKAERDEGGKLGRALAAMTKERDELAKALEAMTPAPAAAKPAPAAAKPAKK